MPNQLPPNIVFLTDFYLNKDPQKNPRLGFAKKAVDMGLRGFGGEFLFMQNADLNGLEKQVQKARQIKKQLETWFEQTYFSIHAPWLPLEKTMLEEKNSQSKNLQRLLSFCSDFVEIVNVHVGLVPLDYWKKKLENNIEQKRENMEKIKTKLDALSDFGNRLCVESMFSDFLVSKQPSYMTNLPSGLNYFSTLRNVDVTIDTAHTGITIKQCEWMEKNRVLLPGFFEEDWKEIRKVAEKKMAAYVDGIKKIGHIHFNDFEIKKTDEIGLAQDGHPIGGGSTSPKILFEWLDALANRSKKNKIGVTLEIKEQNYSELKNSMQTLQAIGEQYGIGH